MTKILAAALFALVLGSLAVQAMPPAAVAGNTPVPPSFDMAMPAPQAALDVSQAALPDVEQRGTHAG